MNNQNFTMDIWVSKPSSAVYQQILDVRSWWSGLFDESFEGSSSAVGDEFSFTAGGGLHYTKQRLIELIPDSRIVWLVTEANLSFAEITDEWAGSRICFTLLPEANGTRIKFIHEGLTPSCSCYTACSDGWNRYLHERMAVLLGS
jgi:hypothetical protein